MAVTEVKNYQAFRGVDYSASPAVISEDHASDLLNMYIGSDGVMQKRPGWHILNTFWKDAVGQHIYGLHYVQYRVGMGMLFIHAGTSLYGTTFMHQGENIGDMNGDGDITAADAVMILQALSGTRTLTQKEMYRSDVDGDGKVTEEDAKTILRMVVGLEPKPDESCGVLASAYFKVKMTDNTDLVMNAHKSVSFEHDQYLYIIDGKQYIRLVPTYATSQQTIGGQTIDLPYINSVKAEVVEGYIPTTAVNGHYEYDELNEEGTNTPGSAENPGVWKHVTLNEERNLLQTKQINTFASDGIHKAFYLYENNCDVHKVEIYKRTRCHSENGQDIPDPSGSDPTVYYYWKYLWTEVAPDDATYGYTVTQASESTPIQNAIAYATKIQFTNTPAAIEEGGVNIRVTYSPRKHSSAWAISKDRGYIEKCSIVTKFGYYNDNRFFLAGNPDHRNMDFMSAVDDPTYFPNTGWTLIGSKLTAIMGYLHYGSELAIVKEDNEQDATVYMRSAILTEDNNIIFPVQQGAQGMGAISQYAFGVLRDDPIFLAKEGVYAIQGTDASQERNLPNRSFYIDPVLRKEASAMCHAAVWGDYYVLCNPVTGKCFVADARYMGLPPGTNNRSHGYEWYVWDNIPAVCFCVVGDRLFFGTADGRLCVFNSDWDNPKRYSDGAEFVNGSTVLHKWNPYDGGYPIHAYYVTKRDHLGALDFKKTMLNDGGVITLQPYERSSAAITVTTDKGEWFVDQIHTDSDEPSVVIPIRHRFKWFDSIETRIENNEMDEGLAILGVQYRYAITTNRR